MVSQTLYIWFQIYETSNGGEYMNKTAVVTAMILGMVAVTGTAFAFNGGFSLENREAVMSAIENGDYEAWKAAIEDDLTEENFNRLVEMNQNRWMERQNMEAMRQAIENRDYEAWQAAVQNCERCDASEVTEEQFNLMVQIHEARMNGDFETANQLSQELGFNCGMFGDFGGKMERRMGPMIPLEGE